jgi:hypothetical protein
MSVHKLVPFLSCNVDVMTWIGSLLENDWLIDWLIDWSIGWLNSFALTCLWNDWLNDWMNVISRMKHHWLFWVLSSHWNLNECIDIGTSLGFQLDLNLEWKFASLILQGILLWNELCIVCVWMSKLGCLLTRLNVFECLWSVLKCSRSVLACSWREWEYALSVGDSVYRLVQVCIAWITFFIL